jgi:predicted phage tail protein
LPLTTVFGGLTFLLVTIFGNRDSKAILWKSSSIALLSHQISGFRQQMDDIPSNQSQLKRRAREIKVVLSGDERLSLVQAYDQKEITG